MKEIEIDSNKFRGILIKGPFKYKNLSFHTVIESVNKTYNKVHHCAGKKLDIRTKSTQNTAYFEPKSKLSSGYYVAWIGEDLWFIRLK